MPTLRFELRMDKVDKEGAAPIRLLYQVSGQRKSFPTGLKCFRINWDSDQQRAVYLDKKELAALGKRNEKCLSRGDVDELNHDIQRLESDVKDLETLFRIEKKEFTPETMVAALKEKRKPLAKKDEPGVFVVDFIARFVRETNDHKPGTLNEYKTLAKHLKEFEELRKMKFTFEGDAIHLFAFSDFLTKKKGVNNITKAKLINTFKSTLKHAHRVPYKIKYNYDYLDVRVKRNDTQIEIVHLEEEELQAMLDLDLSGNRSLDESRDIFCFSCATSLRYQDLRQLEWKHIYPDEKMIIIPSSNKNGKRLEIPLNPISGAILKKYADRPRPLPTPPGRDCIISSQKLGNNIKKVGRLAGIDSPILKVREYGKETRSLGAMPKYQRLSIHVGRKTFVTISLNRGVPLHEVMAITSHANYNSMKPYTKISVTTKKAAMATAWGTFEGTITIAA